MHYPALFYNINFAIPVGLAPQHNGQYVVADGAEEAVLGYDARTSQRAKSLTNLGNQVLRDLRFAVDVEGLTDALTHLQQRCSAAQ
jgi:hypothetical protein